ncbi:MAG: hypothetical protein KDI13_07315 [Alphaproteobacteria bacterium]|nr:hypothetical protein [Alphaproteobacteria bacterium]
MKQGKLVALVALGVMALPLGACEMYAPGSITEQRMQVQESVFSEDMMLSDFSDAHVSALARHYTAHGDGGLDVTVTYDPRSYRNTAMYATQGAAKIASDLRDAGVDDVRTNILPVQGQGDDAHVMVRYNSYTAKAPDGCGTMPGFSDGRKLEYNPDYKLGCTVDTMIAKQVAHPKDLLGQGNVDETTEGRSAANIIEVYRSGAKNEPLQGQTASE